MVKVMLDLDYPIRSSEQRAMVAQCMQQEQALGRPASVKKRSDYLRLIRRGISESFIRIAAACTYPNGMTSKEAAAFQPIRLELDKETVMIQLPEPTFSLLCDLFFSAHAEEHVRIAPEASHWFTQWLKYLRQVRDAAAA